MRIVFMGTPDFAILPLRNLVVNRHEILAVYTRPEKPSGRGRVPVSPPVAQFASYRGIPVVQVPSFKSEEAVKYLQDLRPEVIVVAAFGHILPQAVLDIPTYGCINIHPSLLPRYRGVSPVSAAILAGDEFVGVSVMLLDAGMDSGPVYTQAQIPVLSSDTAESLNFRLFQIGAGLLLEVLTGLQGGSQIPEAQNSAEATFSQVLSKEDGRINWKLSAIEIWRSIRAYQPWPGAYTSWKGKQLKIIEAIPLDELSSLEVGKVISLLPGDKIPYPAFAVTTGNNCLLGVLKVQLEGKRPVNTDEFLRGQRGFLDSTLA